MCAPCFCVLWWSVSVNVTQERYFAIAPSTYNGTQTWHIPFPVIYPAGASTSVTAQFSTVLTPNYNEGHRDHVHLDARPDDTRVFLR